MGEIPTGRLSFLIRHTATKWGVPHIPPYFKRLGMFYLKNDNIFIELDSSKLVFNSPPRKKGNLFFMEHENQWDIVLVRSDSLCVKSLKTNIMMNIKKYNDLRFRIIEIYRPSLRRWISPNE